MLYLINKAWVETIAKQLKNNKIQSALCIYSSSIELSIILKMKKKYDVVIDSMSVAEIQELFYKNKGFDLPIYDEILISHDLYDVYIKDYLAKLCRRTNKELRRKDI